jgi:SAM-dependent methyltransferase
MRSWLRKRAQEADRSLLFLDRVTDWSVLRRVTPYRAEFGRRRGKCIDRYYIEQFLATYAACIQGSVAEIGDDEYTRQFGSGKVVHSDILDVNDRNARRTITIDLARTESAQESVYDCIICTQTLFQIFDYAATVRSLHKMLKPGGSLLATLPGISQTTRGPLLAGAGADWWRFTARSAKRVFGDVFGDGNVILHTYGNVLTATALLHGLVEQELTQAELDYHDPDYEVSIAVKATRNSAK